MYVLTDVGQNREQLKGRPNKWIVRGWSSNSPHCPASLRIHGSLCRGRLSRPWQRLAGQLVLLASPLHPHVYWFRANSLRPIHAPAVLRIVLGSSRYRCAVATIAQQGSRINLPTRHLSHCQRNYSIALHYWRQHPQRQYLCGYCYNSAQHPQVGKLHAEHLDLRQSDGRANEAWRFYSVRCRCAVWVRDFLSYSTEEEGGSSARKEGTVKNEVTSTGHRFVDRPKWYVDRSYDMLGMSQQAYNGIRVEACIFSKVVLRWLFVAIKQTPKVARFTQAVPLCSDRPSRRPGNYSVE
jgi:hypothetical protein